MSGIGGIVHLDGRPVEQEALLQLRQRVGAYGPDGAGAWQAGAAGLVHCLLHSTPESVHEVQPLAANGLVITADARLDNRAELSAALGVADSGQPDEALILAAYARWGEACPDHLLGDFAFAIWDTTTQRLFCARDCFGVRPCYYYHGPSVFVFASALEGVARHPGVPRAINEARLADYLTGGSDPANTFYQDIYKLPPAHCLTVSTEGLRLQRYWDVRAPRETGLPSDEAYAEAFRQLLDEAVSARLRSATPVAAMLSGGLDSSSVVCLARPKLAASQPLHTYSLVYNAAPASDERQFMRPVVAGGGLVHHEIAGDGVSALTDVETLLAVNGEPYYHFGLALYGLIDEAVRAAGGRVLLGGDFGDAVVSHANLHLAELVRRGRWVSAVREVNGLAGGLGMSRRATFNHFFAAGIVPQLPPDTRRAWRRLRGRLRGTDTSWALGHIIQPDFAQRIQADPALRARLEQRQPTLRDTREENQLHVDRTYIQGELFSHLAAYAGIEVRHPFVDRRLVEFCLGLPGEQRMRGGWTRLIQRRAMAGVLPDEIRWRRDKVIPIQSVSRALMDQHLPELERLLAPARQAGEWLNVGLIERDLASLKAAAARGEQEHRRHRPALGRLARALHVGLWLRRAGFI